MRAHPHRYQGTHLSLLRLLQAGANPILPDSDGRIPLHWATNNLETTCLSVLLQKVKGADVNGITSVPLLYPIPPMFLLLLLLLRFLLWLFLQQQQQHPGRQQRQQHILKGKGRKRELGVRAT